MKLARIQLIIAAALFVGWLGFLAYLALGHAQPMVVSRSQLMNATSSPTVTDTSGSWVIADIDVDENGKPRRTAVIKKVYAGEPIAEESIVVANLPEARVPPNKSVPGKGTYLLPLVRNKELLRYWIASTRWIGSDDPTRGPLIYPWTPEVEEQLKKLLPKPR